MNIFHHPYVVELWHSLTLTQPSLYHVEISWITEADVVIGDEMDLVTIECV